MRSLIPMAGSDLYWWIVWAIGAVAVALCVERVILKPLRFIAFYRAQGGALEVNCWRFAAPPVTGKCVRSSSASHLCCPVTFAACLASPYHRARRSAWQALRPLCGRSSRDSCNPSVAESTPRRPRLLREGRAWWALLSYARDRVSAAHSGRGAPAGGAVATLRIEAVCVVHICRARAHREPETTAVHASHAAHERSARMHLSCARHNTLYA